MMGIVPIKLAHLKIGPVLDLPFGEHGGAVARLQQLDERDYAVVQAGGGVGGDRNPIARQVDLVGLPRQDVAIAILRLAGPGTVRSNNQAQRAGLAARIPEFQVEARFELFVQDFDGGIAGRDSLALESPVARKNEIGSAQPNHLWLRHYHVPAGNQRRYRVRRCGHDE